MLPQLAGSPFINDGGWRRRSSSTRASSLLDEGDPAELAARYRELRERLPNLNVVGGCCGTDHRHIDEICAAVV